MKPLSDPESQRQPQVSVTNNDRGGVVYLVGAGPGDPDLLTLKAARLIASAEVVLYDKLISDDIIGLVGSQALKIYVGKERSRHTLPQDAINALLIEQARLGKRVVRLKSGDPFVFGRGGEELQELEQAGVSFEVVPGITAACGVSSYAGIPLTHRDFAQSCTFVTGHLKDGTCNLDWPTLARPKQTIVIYMGLLGLPEICAQLIRHGLSPDWPAAVVACGTQIQQKTVCSTLSELPKAVEQAGLQSPSLTIVGEVVRLRKQLSWFEAHQRARASAV